MQMLKRFALFALFILAVAACGAATITFVDAPTGYAGPYRLLEDGRPIWGTCYNFTFHVAPPYVWEAQEYQVTDFSDPEPTNLLEAEWLNTQFAASPDTVGIHQAIWDLFGSAFTDAGTLAWEQSAQRNYGSIDPATFYMLIPAAATSIQPFLVTRADPPPQELSPEPGTWLLCGGVLLIVVGWRSGRR
jgi:hypothetical protein